MSKQPLPTGEAAMIEEFKKEMSFRGTPEDVERWALNSMVVCDRCKAKDQECQPRKSSLICVECYRTRQKCSRVEMYHKERTMLLMGLTSGQFNRLNSATGRGHRMPNRRHHSSTSAKTARRSRASSKTPANLSSPENPVNSGSSKVPSSGAVSPHIPVLTGRRNSMETPPHNHGEVNTPSSPEPTPRESWTVLKPLKRRRVGSLGRQRLEPVTVTKKRTPNGSSNPLTRHLPKRSLVTTPDPEERVSDTEANKRTPDEPDNHRTSSTPMVSLVRRSGSLSSRGTTLDPDQAEPGLRTNDMTPDEPRNQGTPSTSTPARVPLAGSPSGSLSLRNTDLDAEQTEPGNANDETTTGDLHDHGVEQPSVPGSVRSGGNSARLQLPEGSLARFRGSVPSTPNNDERELAQVHREMQALRKSLEERDRQLAAAVDFERDRLLELHAQVRELAMRARLNNALVNPEERHTAAISFCENLESWGDQLVKEIGKLGPCKPTPSLLDVIQVSKRAREASDSEEQGLFGLIGEGSRSAKRLHTERRSVRFDL